MDARTLIVTRAARFFHDGDLVNLGIGMPTLVANHLPEGVNITLQSENGFIGLGPTPEEGHVDKDMVNAGGQPVTILEVDQEGNLANWMIPGKKVPGMGGAMDLVAGANLVIITMEHCNKSGAPKILKKCTLPLTAAHEVDYIVTELCVLHRTEDGLVLEELAPGVTVEEVLAKTDAELIVPTQIGSMV